jgi:aquaporin Z
MQKALLAEFLGTLLLVFVIFVTGNYLAIGAALAVGVLLCGTISGAAFNPVVALTLTMAGKLHKNQLLPYLIAETLGAIAGYYLSKQFK